MYEDKTPETIKQEILDALVSDLDKQEGSFVDDMAGPAALEMWKMYRSLDAVQPMVWVDETSGAYLELAVAERGIPPRKAGICAVCARVRLTGTPRQRVEKGKALMTADGLYFYTDAAVMLDEKGVGVVSATAAEVGYRYNVAAGEICRQFQNEVKEVEGLAPAMGGSEPESDVSLYARLKTDREKPRTSGNVYDYEVWALATPGVGIAKVFPLWNGAGTVRVVVANDERRPVDDVVVQRCVALIEQERPVGATVTVQSAETIAVNVTAQITSEDGAGVEAIQEMFVRRLEEYLQIISFVATEVSYHQIGAMLIETQGVADYAELLLCGGTVNLPIGETQVPVVGEVTLAC